MTVNADGTRTVLCPDGTKVTLQSGFIRGPAQTPSQDERAAAEQA